MTPGGIDCHVHLLSPQVCDAALAGGLTTLVTQDFGPVWNLGTNPPEAEAMMWSAFDAIPHQRGDAGARPRLRSPSRSSTRWPEAAPASRSTRTSAPGRSRSAARSSIADRHDVQLAIHTDGLNEALSLEDTFAAFGGRTVHAYHIEGVGGGHAPNLLELAGRDRVLTSSTTPHGAVRRVDRGRAPGDGGCGAPARADRTRAGDAEILRHRVREWTMAAESVLHDLGVIHMLSSDSQGMGRIGEVVRRAFQCADAMKAQFAAESASADNERVLRYLAKVTINPAITHGLAAHVGSLEVGKLADLVLWAPEFFAVRPELILKAGMPAWGASGDGNGSTMMVEPVTVERTVCGDRIGTGADIAGVPAPAPRWRPSCRRNACGRGCERCRDLTAADMVRNTRTGTVTVDGGRARGDARRRARCGREPVERLAFSGSYLLG